MGLDKLIKNYKKFKKEYFEENRKLFLDLVKKGQNPKALFIGCSDSRVIPNLITKSDPGDLFVLRNVGNFVPPFKADLEFHATAAAIEYAVSVLKVENIIVCGHSYCGACESLYKEIPDELELIHIKKWLEIGYPAKDIALREVGEKDKDVLLRYTEKASLLLQIENLLTYPGVKKRVDSKNLFVHGWYYKIESGDIEYYDWDKKEYILLDRLNQE